MQLHRFSLRTNPDFSGGAWCLAALTACLLLGASVCLADGWFYAAPKVMVGTLKAHIDAPSLTVREVPGQSYKPVTQGEFKGVPLDGQKTAAFAALAFGVDFQKLISWPLRLELEVTTRADANFETPIGGVWYHGDAPGEPHFEENVYGDGRGIVGLGNSSLSCSVHAAFLNLYADWHNSSRFTPYAGGGLGLAFIETKAVTGASARGIINDNPYTVPALEGGPGIVVFEDRRKQFAWHLEIGLAYDLTDNFSFVAGYRYLNLGKEVRLDDIQQKTWNEHDGKYIGADEIYSKGPSRIEFSDIHLAMLNLNYVF
jgi:opacity protein-like surface antigen